MIRKGPSPESTEKLNGGENGFHLSLPMTVLGYDQFGSDFEETTVLDDMSYTEAFFKLKKLAAKGTHLKLIISLPKKLSEGQDLRLVIRGTVMSIDRVEENGSLNRVGVKLGARYVIKPEVMERVE